MSENRDRQSENSASLQGDLNRLADEAAGLGVSSALVFDASLIKADEGFRKYCEQNVCGKYNTTWSGPPAVGPISKLIERVREFKSGLFIQNTFKLSDAFDIEGMEEGARIHEERFRKVLNHIRSNYTFKKILPLNAGCCSLCPKCAYQEGKTCRHPDQAVSSVECYGIDVSELKRSMGLPVTSGQDTVSYVALILIEN